MGCGFLLTNSKAVAVHEEPLQTQQQITRSSNDQLDAAFQGVTCARVNSTEHNNKVS